MATASNDGSRKEHDLDNEQHLSNHTISIRAALNHCKALLESSPLDPEKCLDPNQTETALDAWRASQSISQQRNNALKETPSMKTVESDEISVQEFRKHYLHANRPCVIRGLSKNCFSRVTSTWRTSDTQINKEWFQHHLGDDTLVPVRQQYVTQAGLDEQGRAEECSTVEMPLREWRRQSATCCPSLYLKDWHFQKWWETTHDSETDPLYTVPPLFGYDLLNSFLLRYTEGDYRFVYWGPPKSQTPLHSDVLHSCSWSYNVVGVKKWTFIVPETSQEVELYQHAGETVFVPSTWKHKVENLCETLSINHNWITTATIDLTWNCLQTEMQTVDEELNKWNKTDEPWDAKEFMLRGCVGLDVTAFFFMVVTTQLELLTNDEYDDNWERFFSLFRLHQVLEAVKRPEVCLEQRLAAVLEWAAFASEAIKIADTVMEVIDTVKATLLQ